MRANRKIVHILLLFALVGGGVALRLLAVPPALPDLDAVNFARSLAAFDIAAQAPHFPGYPIYVALARFFAALGLHEVAALAAPGWILGALASLALGLVLLRIVGSPGALAATAVLSFAPLAVLQGGLPHSDGAGFAALVLAIAAALVASPSFAAAGSGDGAAISEQGSSSRLARFMCRHAALVAGVTAGLTLGIRPSYLPAIVALPLLLAGASRLRWAAGAALGTASWLLPLVLLVGPRLFATIATSFLRGHAGEWGGTIIVRPDLVERLSWLGFDLAAAGLGLPWSELFGPGRIALALLLAIGAAALFVTRTGRISSPALIAALLVGVPYGAWAFVGQNLIKARHVLPLLAAAALLISLAPAALALRRRWLAPAWTAALALSFAATALPLALEQGRVPAPGVQLVRHVAADLPAAGASYFTGEEARLFERYAPQFRANRLAGGAELESAAGRLAAAGVQVYVSSAAPGFELLHPGLEPVATFSTSPLVRAHANPIVLYRYRPAVAGRGEIP